jgi:hypothetical protein
VARIDQLFAIDAEAHRKTLITAARHIRRQERIVASARNATPCNPTYRPEVW